VLYRFFNSPPPFLGHFLKLSELGAHMLELFFHLEVKYN
jgi:hypothetical protein